MAGQWTTCGFAPDGKLLREPFCYRDERTVASKETADASSRHPIFTSAPARFRCASTPSISCWPIRAAGNRSRARRGSCCPSTFSTGWAGGAWPSTPTPRTRGLVNLKTGDWDAELFGLLELPIEAAPPIVRAGTILGPLQGPLAALDAFRDDADHRACLARHGLRHRRHSRGPEFDARTSAPAHGRWWAPSTPVPVTTQHAFDAGYTNIGAATGGLLFHSLINSMWVLKQCMDGVGGAGASLVNREARPRGCRMQFGDGRARYGRRTADARLGHAASASTTSSRGAASTRFPMWRATSRSLRARSLRAWRCATPRRRRISRRCSAASSSAST